MTDLHTRLRQGQYHVTPTFDGRLHRFDRAGDRTGWFRGVTVEVGGEKLFRAKWGDWKTGEAEEWASSATPEAVAAFHAADESAAQEKAESEEKVAKVCQEIWEAAIDRGDSPYFAKKMAMPDGGAGLGECRLDPTDPSVTLVPAKGPDNKLWGLQRISADGSKYFTEGMRIKGSAYYLGWLPGQGPGEVYLCEGAATAQSIYQALLRHSSIGPGISVVSCFNAANLVHVAKALWEFFQARGMTLPKAFICADNDLWTTKPNGTPWNPGLEYARKAAPRLGATVLFPRFRSHEGRPTDFNDLHIREGLDEAILQLTSPPQPETASPGSGDTLLGRPPRAVPPRMSAKGLPTAPSQQSLVEHLLEHFDGALLKQDRDLFWYTGTHWQWLRSGEHDRIKQLIQESASGMLGYKDVIATFNLLLTYLPSPPQGVDMFTPHPFATNFLNGTLHLAMGAEAAQAVGAAPGADYALTFTPHRREDYLTNVLPYEYRAGDSSRNVEFESMLARVFEGDPDKPDKIRALRQMFGACLMPAFPRLFMLHGKSGSGKSTVLQIARRMVSPSNISHVPPSEFHGFHMETMAGKLVNIDTDIPLHRPINDEIVKKIVERRPFRIRRKGIRDLEAPIPSVHLFGGNGIPAAIDGASGAHTRRWTFVEFAKFQPQGQYRLEYWDWCFEQSPQGVLNFALEGLQDLCASRGHFVQPASGAAKVAEWQLRSDPVGSFIQDLEEGEIVEGQARMLVGPTLRVERKKLYEAFKVWFEDFDPGRRPTGKKVFFDAMRAKGFEEYRTREGRYFRGVGVE